MIRGRQKNRRMLIKNNFDNDEIEGTFMKIEYNNE